MAYNEAALAGGKAGVLLSYPNIAGMEIEESKTVLGIRGFAPIMSVQDPNVQAQSRVAATTTDTISGTPAADDVISVTFGVRGGVTVSFTVVGTPTTTQVATSLAAAVNAETRLNGYIRATSAAAVVTFHHAGGVGGNYVTVEKADDGDTVQTLGAAILSGGSGPILAKENFPSTVQAASGGIIGSKLFVQDNYYELPDNIVEMLVEAGAPVA